jgi:hypothetical protein
MVPLYSLNLICSQMINTQFIRNIFADISRDKQCVCIHCQTLPWRKNLLLKQQEV